MSARAKDVSPQLIARDFVSSGSSLSTVRTSIGHEDYSPDEYVAPITSDSSGYWSGSFPMSITIRKNDPSRARGQSVIVAEGTVPDRYGYDIVIGRNVIQFKAAGRPRLYAEIFRHHFIDTPEYTDSDSIVKLKVPDFGSPGTILSDIAFTDPDEIADQWVSPFEIINVQASELVQEEIDKFLGLGRPDSQSLHVRLSDLFKISKEEPEYRVVSPASIRFLRNFLEKNSKINTPSLFLADSGAVRAQWNCAPNKALALLFQQDGAVDYVLFAPDRRRPSITGDHAGSTAWQSALPIFRRSSRTDWLFSE